MSRRSFVNGALILMAAGFIVRILGFVYRVYLSNMIGAEGMGLFQLISPIYSLVILTLTSGVSISVSKLVAAELAQNHYINLRRVTRCALIMVVTAGIAVSVFMFIYMDFIVNVIIKDGRTYYSFMLMIPCIPVIAASSAIKGYFYGVQDVTPTAISQIVEQVVKICLVMSMAGAAMRVGIAYACALATVGMTTGEIGNLMVVFIIYKLRRRKSFVPKNKSGILRKRTIAKEILKVSIPVSFNRFITSIMSAIEMILIPRRLLAGGLAYNLCIEEFGKLSGMVMPLIFFPALVTSSLATTLVPAISEGIALNDYRKVNYRISKSVKLSFILGFIFTTIFLSYSDKIANMIYRKQNVGEILYLMGFTCIFMYVSQTMLGVLNGLGKQGISLRNSIVGYIIRIGFVYFLIPVEGIKGYVLGVIVSMAVVCAMNLFTVSRTTGMYLDLKTWIFKPAIVAGGMFFAAKYVYAFCEIFRLSQLWTTLGALCLITIISLLLMYVIGAIDRQDLKNLIGNKKLRKT